MAKRLKALQKENVRPKKMVAEQALDMEILKEAAKGNYLVNPERRRRTTTEVRRRLGPQKVSERRACRVLDQPRSTQRYQLRRVDDEPRLLREMRALARQRPRFGAKRIHRVLVERHWQVNHKRVHPLWKRENMQVPRKQHRRGRFSGGSENSCVRRRSQHKNHVWSYDYGFDLAPVFISLACPCLIVVGINVEVSGTAVSYGAQLVSESLPCLVVCVHLFKRHFVN